MLTANLFFIFLAQFFGFFFDLLRSSLGI